MNQPGQRAEARIVAAAVQLFARHGFQGTTTREIARLAGVNEATLFRHFGRKADLFWASLHAELEKVRLGRELQNGLAEVREPAVVLPMLFELMVSISIYQPELMRLLLFSALELRPNAEQVFRKQLGPGFDRVTTYLDRCVERGWIRPVDTFMALSAFATSIAAHSGLHGLLTGKTIPYVNSREAVTAYSDFWLAGLLPNGEPAANVGTGKLTGDESGDSAESIPSVGD